MEQQAKDLRRDFEAKLFEERSLREEMGERVEGMQTAYHELSDTLEAEQQHSSQQLAMTTLMLKKVTKELERSKRQEAKLAERLIEAEAKEWAMEEGRKRLANDLTDADERERELTRQLGEQERAVREVQELLAATEDEYRQLRDDQQEMELKSETQAAWLDEANESNRELRERLEIREEELAAQYEEAPAATAEAKGASKGRGKASKKGSCKGDAQSAGVRAASHRCTLAALPGKASKKGRGKGDAQRAGTGKGHL
eukprot:CAMPEP_0117617480 /NCGR_PEP_ID=MMETSP0784-20121206/85614_1 /TAXON_ID=39447 /ORGANISM="" /LENGTH=256 /DNA_ID=CAMNT_0005421323 /DNA_START=403 /DNA_END=1173 /DNA_ORIENTATION=-